MCEMLCARALSVARVSCVHTRRDTWLRLLTSRQEVERLVRTSSSSVVTRPRWRQAASFQRMGAQARCFKSAAVHASSSTSGLDAGRLIEPRRGFRRSSRSRLGPSDAQHFEGDTEFERVARLVCQADCLPRKELFETWEAAQLISAEFSGSFDRLKIVDLAAGHGLLVRLCTPLAHVFLFPLRFLVVFFRPTSINAALCHTVGVTPGLP